MVTVRMETTHEPTYSMVTIWQKVSSINAIAARLTVPVLKSLQCHMDSAQCATSIEAMCVEGDMPSGLT